jgi:hypothetical protein
MKSFADEHGILFVFPPAPWREMSAQSTPDEILKSINGFMLPSLKNVVSDAGKACRDALGIQSADDLLNASVRDFLKFLNRTAGSSHAAMESYGMEYCLKLAYEYNRVSNTRANRSNYKKKLLQLGDGDVEQAITRHAKRVIRDFVS